MNNIKLILVVAFLIICNACGLAQSQDFPGTNRKCVSKSEMDSLFAGIRARSAQRDSNNNNITSAERTSGTLEINHAFIWPIRAAPDYYQPDFYYISNYVDLDGCWGCVEDYHCGDRSYDLDDYDHSGIDIATGPFGWKLMDENKVHVIAAEGGVIEAKHVGEPSRTCRTGVATPYHGNYIAIKHSNGTITMYMHMKGGTLTSKSVGETVVTGEYLGVVGSSGNSSGPHLHFEVRSSTDRILDPFQNGVCKDDVFGQITQSLWANEEPYHNKKILSVFTLSAPWTNASCDTNGITSGISETVPYRNHFSESNVIYFSAAVRDIHQGNTVRLRILNPAGLEIYDNTYTAPASDTFRKIRLVPAQFTFAPAAVGTYRLLCTYNSKTETHLFTVGCPGALTLSGTRVSNSGAISGSTINSTETLSSTVQNVKYEAETSIQFNPGFQAVAGSDFIARITPCTVGGQ